MPPQQENSSLWAAVVALAQAERQWKEKEQEPEGDETSTTVDDNPNSFEWLNAAFIAESTGDDENDIQDLTVKNAVAVGNNYCSTMLRVRATLASDEDRVINLVVKVLPAANFMVDFVSEFGFFKREIEVLMNALPALQELGTSRCGPDSLLAQPLGACALPCSRGDTLVMHDLGVQGYGNADRRNQLDMPHCKVSLAILARLHALSVALHREDPEAMERYGENMYLEAAQENGQYIARMFESFGKELVEWEEFEGSDFPARIQAVADSSLAQMCECVDRKEGSRFNALNHGDYWTNNIMYRYDNEGDEEPADVRMVDFQMARFASMALDLQYFINTSVREEIFLTSLEDLLEFYRLEFNENLSQLGVSDGEIGAEELQHEFDSRAIFGMHAFINITCLVVAAPSERLVMEEVTSETFGSRERMATSWRGSKYRGLVPKRMEYFANVGAF